MLDVLGIDADAEAVYDALLRQPTLTREQLADLVAADVPAALLSLSDKGLVRGPDAAGGYAAIPPDIALRGLATTLEHRLGQARARIATLSDVYNAAPRDGGDVPVEVVPGDEAIERFRVLSIAAHTEIRVFETPPYVDAGNLAPWPVEMEALGRGVRFRVVYSRAAMETQTEAELREPIEAGEQARVVDVLPLRLMLVDRELAMLPAWTDHPLTDGLLVVRRGGLLHALSSLFETVWARALPLSLSAEPEQPGTETLVALLAAGLGDQAVARHLGLSLRTVQRRIQELMRSVNAATRFQAGVAVGRGGARSE